MSYGIDPQESSPGHAGASAPSFTPAAYGRQPYPYPTGSQPGEPVTFAGAVRNFFRKYAQFSGRASRSEFWWAYLAQVLLLLAMAVVWVVAVVVVVTSAENSAGGQPNAGAVSMMFGLLAVISLIGLALVVPNISLTVRRLHDTGKSGWYYFLSFIPGVGGIILLVLCAMEPDPSGAAFDA